MLKRLTYEEVYNRFKEKGYTLIDKEYHKNNERLSCVDNDGYKYCISTNSLSNGSLPEKYNKFNPYTLDNVKLLLKLESKGSKLITSKYTNSKMKLTITCECCGKEITKKWDNIITDKSFKCYQCNYDSTERKLSFDFVKTEFKNNGYEILDDNYKGNNNSINCLDSDGYYVKMKYTSLNKKEPYRFSIRFNKENYIKNINHWLEINKINCEALYYLKDKTLKGDAVVVCKCSCGDNFNTSWGAIKDMQVRCKKCSQSMSKMEYKVEKWLLENKVEYIFQKKFEDCKKIRCLPFDFYLPKYNCCIEVDGQQHYFPSKFSQNLNEVEEFNKVKEHDKIKNEYCKNNNIDLLRISFNDIRRKNNNYISILSNKFIKE